MVSLQVPVLDAVIAKKPDAIMIAPTDKVQLVAAVEEGTRCRYPDRVRRYLIGTGVFQTGSGDADFPISYVASDNVLGGRMAARWLKAIGEKGKVYVSNVKPGISTTDQREEGFKDEMKKYPASSSPRPSSTMTMPTRPPPRCRPCLAACRIWPVFSGANLFSATGTANGVTQAGQAGKIKIAGFDAPESIVPQLKDGTFTLTIAQHPAEIGYFGFIWPTPMSPTTRFRPPHRHWLYGDDRRQYR